MADSLSGEWFRERLTARSMRGIAVETSALIRSGIIPVGAKLPPVRDIALALGVSPATISSAWSELRRHNVISGRGRNGVWVCGDQFAPRPSRFESVGNFGDHVIDLSLAVPDPALLPPLGDALLHGAGTRDLNSYVRVPILDELQQAASRHWPYPAEAFLATNGGYEAVYLCLQALVMPGSVVAVEDPTAMRLLDILDNLGAHLVPVKCDAEGPCPQSLSDALKKRPAAFLYQPRTHSATGAKVSAARMEALAEILEGSDLLIVEDDGIGNLSCLPPASLGRYFPDRTVHVLSLSKTLGPDLRLAVLSGSARIVEQIQAYRSFGAGWTSRVIQAAGAFLMTDPVCEAAVDKARSIYQARRLALITALCERKWFLPDGDGLCVWLPVRSEQFALVTLAARGIAALPGSKCSMTETQHIRIATSMLTDRVEFVADALALVRARGTSRQ